MARGFLATDRTILRVVGSDAASFLQDLVSNDLDRTADGLVYAALLSPQGKYLFDFLIARDQGGFLLDVKADRAEPLARRLAMYRLRARVTIEPAGLAVAVLLDEPATGALADPRHPALGWRLYAADPAPALAGRESVPQHDWDTIRVAQAIPETGIELIPDDSYILEAGFERLHGVDFRKGCYVGQEVTARMKHKTELRKGLTRVQVEGEAPPPGTPITAEGRPAGTLYTSAGGFGLAHLRFDRATGAMEAGPARISLPEAVS